MRTEDAKEALSELVNRAASVGSGWGAWLIRLPDGGWGVSSLMPRHSRPGIEMGEELTLWLEVLKALVEVRSASKVEGDGLEVGR